MSLRKSLEELEQEITALPLRDQLRLIAHISKRLSKVPLGDGKQGIDDPDRVLAICDAAAQMWEGDFDACEDLRKIRKERDEQVWLSE